VDAGSEWGGHFFVSFHIVGVVIVSNDVISFITNEFVNVVKMVIGN
jgi:hypothetical protein